ncbi:MAG: GxxExxY protein [Saprospiraceae bacterium]
MTPHKLNDITYQIIGAAMEVHDEFKAGLTEEIYEEAMEVELKLRNIKVERQVHVPVYYKGIKLKKKYFIDMLVEDKVIVELKCVKEFHPIHEVQLVTYMKLTNKKLGLLLNFNVTKMMDGIKRKVNNL